MLAFGDYTSATAKTSAAISQLSPATFTTGLADPVALGTLKLRPDFDQLSTTGRAGRRRELLLLRVILAFHVRLIDAHGKTVALGTRGV